MLDPTPVGNIISRSSQILHRILQCGCTRINGQSDRARRNVSRNALILSKRDPSSTPPSHLRFIWALETCLYFQRNPLMFQKKRSSWLNWHFPLDFHEPCPCQAGKWLALGRGNPSRSCHRFISSFGLISLDLFPISLERCTWNLEEWKLFLYLNLYWSNYVGDQSNDQFVF